MVAGNELDSAALAGDPADAALVAAPRAGDEAAFRGLVLRHHAAVVALARASASAHAVVEEVAQDTWLAVTQGIGGFECRSSLKSWNRRNSGVFSLAGVVDPRAGGPETKLALEVAELVWEAPGNAPRLTRPGAERP